MTQSKKKIFFMMSTLRGGGAEKVLLDILKRFDYNKYDVELGLIFPIGVYLKDLPKEVKVRALYPEGRFMLRVYNKLIFQWPQKFKLDFIPKLYYNILFKKTYDVEIAFMEGLSTKYLAWKNKRGAKRIAWVHIDLVNNHYTKEYFKSSSEESWYYKQFDKIVFVSKDSKNAFNEKFDVSGTPQFIQNNLIPLPEIMEKGDAFEVQKKAFTLVSVGRLEDQKCFDRLIRLGDRLNADNYEFEIWIVGQGPLLDKLKQQVKELSLEKNVKFLGYQTNPYPFIKASDIYINSSLAEGYPLTVCEAICLNKAIVCTHNSGSEEILGKSEYGLLVDHDDESIYQGVKSLMDDPEKLAYYRQQASIRAIKFDEDKVMAEIFDLIES
ncbi:MAG TPA: glycosyltransferase [Anditalea sp.]|nr:glycosyltransferase [Anditalea sp.]